MKEEIVRNTLIWNFTSLNYHKVNTGIENSQINKVEIIDVHRYIKLCTAIIKNTPTVQILWLFIKSDNIFGHKETPKFQESTCNKDNNFVHKSRTRNNKIRNQLQQKSFTLEILNISIF